MIENLYIEKSILKNELTRKIIKRVKAKSIVECNSYNEIFNLKKQNFSVQKDNPSMILAKKRNNFILEVPKKFCLDSQQAYYFSHMLNCIYDCKYCFLQGMFRSANFVIFVNYESFMNEIKHLADSNKKKPMYFFSGYDCDSLAFEHITNFAETFIPFFKKFKNVNLELRTKSTKINSILKFKPKNNIIIAWSLNPDDIILEFEKNTPSLKNRLKAIKVLQNQGWKIGLRFDPIIYHRNFKKIYVKFFESIFSSIENKNIHSVTIGTLRFPKDYFFNIKKDKLFDKLKFDGNLFGYKNEIRDELTEFCYEILSKKIDKDIIYLN